MEWMTHGTGLVALGGLAWVALMFAVARICGWTELAETYPPGDGFAGVRFRFRSASLRYGMGVRGALQLGVSPRGLHVSMFAPLRIGFPPFEVPWDEVRVSEGTTWRIRFARLHFRRAPSVPFAITTSQARELAEAAGDRWPEASTRD